VHSFGSGQQARLVFELPIGGEGHPESFESFAREGRGHDYRLIRWWERQSVAMIRKINTRLKYFCGKAPKIASRRGGMSIILNIPG
jgi:hypothetical protein